MCSNLVLLASRHLEAGSQYLHTPRCYLRCSDYWNNWHCVTELASDIGPQTVQLLALQILLYLVLVAVTSHLHVTIKQLRIYQDFFHQQMHSFTKHIKC